MGKNKQDPPKNKSDRLLQALRPLAEALRKIPDELGATWNSIRTDPQVGPIARALVERDPEAWSEVLRQVRPYYWPRILAAAQRDPTTDLPAMATTACWLVLRRTVGHLTPGETKAGWRSVQLRLRRAIELQLSKDLEVNRRQPEPLALDEIQTEEFYCTPNPLEAMEAAERQSEAAKRLGRILEAATPRQREFLMVFKRYLLEGKSLREARLAAAGEAGLSPGAARALLHRLRRIA